jgi:hypothetical protein
MHVSLANASIGNRNQKALSSLNRGKRRGGGAGAAGAPLHTRDASPEPFRPSERPGSRPPVPGGLPGCNARRPIARSPGAGRSLLCELTRRSRRPESVTANPAGEEPGPGAFPAARTAIPVAPQGGTAMPADRLWLHNHRFNLRSGWTSRSRLLPIHSKSPVRPPAQCCQPHPPLSAGCVDGTDGGDGRRDGRATAAARRTPFTRCARRSSI